MLALYIVLAIFLILAILSVIPVNAVFAVSVEDKLEGLAFFIQYTFIKIRILPSERSEKKAEDKKEDEPEKSSKEEKPSGSKIDAVKKIYRIAAALLPDVERVLARLFTKVFTINDFDLDARIGTEDAMYTGLAIGAANGFVYPLLGVIDHNMELKRFSINIIPDWNNQIVSAAFYTRISTTVARVLRLALMLIPIYFKFRKLNKAL